MAASARGLRAGLVGLGMMGRHHARVLRGLDGVELVAVADAAGDVHGMAGGLPVYPTIDELLALSLDYVVVALPTAFHEKAALACADAGVPMLVEKPLADGVGSAQKVVEAFAAKSLLGAVGHIERYNPALQAARVRLEAGELGEVYQVVTRRQGPFPARIADVGVVKDLATHDIDLTAWVTQKGYESVSAHTAHRSGREHEDLVAVTGLLTGGVVANHLVNWLSPLKERVTVITGERGTFVANTLTADLTFYANGSVPMTWDAVRSFRGVSEGDVIRYAIEKPEPLKAEHEAFRDAVLGSRSDIVTLEQGLRTVQVAEAALRSAASNETVHVGNA